MPTQAHIETAVGITPTVAAFVTSHPADPDARAVRALLRLQVAAVDPSGFVLLTAAVATLRRRLRGPNCPPPAAPRK